MTTSTNINHNTPEYSVSEISRALKRNIEDAFSYVRISGEISGLSRPNSGHLYFSLKDQDAVISAVCWRGIASRIDFNLEDGLEVVATGKVTVYEARGNYQIVCERLELAGQGALMALLEKRKKEYIKEGLFDEAHKKPLPFMPQTIGVITSETGAVIKDILHRISERFPCRVLLKPVKVQGEGSAEEVASAINLFNNIKGNNRPDLLIVARGGGSVEDLWAFNEDAVIRSTFKSKIPIISAVGHETDTTLIDFVSDKRAPTPTAAAEIAVPNRVEMLSFISNQGARIMSLLNNIISGAERLFVAHKNNLRKPRIEEREQRLDDLFTRLKFTTRRNLDAKQEYLTRISSKLITPNERVNNLNERLAANYNRLNLAFKNKTNNAANALKSVSFALSSLSYQNVLKRGFAIVKNEQGKLVNNVQKAKKEKSLQLEFSDGEIKLFTDASNVKPKKVKNSKVTVKSKDEQFNLF